MPARSASHRGRALSPGRSGRPSSARAASGIATTSPEYRLFVEREARLAGRRGDEPAPVGRGRERDGPGSEDDDAAIGRELRRSRADGRGEGDGVGDDAHVDGAGRAEAPAVDVGERRAHLGEGATERAGVGRRRRRGAR